MNCTEKSKKRRTDEKPIKAMNIFANAKAQKWSFPADLPETDICLNDNVLISQFPKLNSCGSLMHAKGATTLMGEEQVAVGIDCCGVCAKPHDERFRCKKCHSIVYCNVAHQAADRGFHVTVCEALQLFDCDQSANNVEDELRAFVFGLRRCPLPPFTEEIRELSLEEIFYEFIFDQSVCSEWKCLHFLHGTPLGRAFMEHASYPLTLWSQWDRLPKNAKNVVHVIGATRSECQFPALWSLLLPRNTEEKGIEEISFFGPHVPKSLHSKEVHGSLRFYRMKYHNAITHTKQRSPTVVFAPAMGITTGHYEWEETLDVLQRTLASGAIIITTCFSAEEMQEERAFLLKRFGWKQICPPYFNPFASTRILQNSQLANDVYRSNSLVSVFQVQ